MLVFRRKRTDGRGNLTEWVIWRVPRDDKHPDGVRYRLAFIPSSARLPAVLYDNHHPKGHHRHVSENQTAYTFVDIPTLLEDFGKDVAAWHTRE
ncbi:MAG: DUF6516 family protein [Elusimicrobia bacterium]|nr:DUF6516 family protein [Elusimicrobiota bacterium]